MQPRLSRAVRTPDADDPHNLYRNRSPSIRNNSMPRSMRSSASESSCQYATVEYAATRVALCRQRLNFGLIMQITTILRRLNKAGNKDVKIRREAAEIAGTVYFDEVFYRIAANIDDSVDAAEHYCRTGWRAGLNPSPYFDTRYYRAQYRDVSNSDANPLIHYLRHGAAEKRQPDPKFDVPAFTASHPEAAEPVSTRRRSACASTAGIRPRRRPRPSPHHYRRLGGARIQTSSPSVVRCSTKLSTSR